MSQNKLPKSFPSIERLVTRVTAAEQSQQKDIRMSIVEGRALISELAMLTSRLGTAIQDINTNLTQIAKSAGNIEIKFDGGGFDQK